MKRIILFTTLILCGYTIAQASILTKNEVELTVGNNPVSILEDPSNGTIHIFCAGIDANGNNIYDEGEDEKPSWWKYNPTGSSSEANKLKEFDNYFVSPFHFDYENPDSKFNDRIFLYFAAQRTDNEISGNGYIGVYYLKHAFEDLFSSSGPADYLKYIATENYSIALKRVVGTDSLYYTNHHTKESNNIDLGGDIIDFVTFKDEEENEYLAPLLNDGDSTWIAVYEFDDNLNPNLLFKSTYIFSSIIIDSIGSLNSFGKTICISSKPNLNVSLFTLNESKTGFSIPNHKPVEIEYIKNNFLLPIADKIHIVSKESKDLVVVDLTTVTDVGQIEMHHSQFEIGYMEFINNQVYCASTFSKEKKSGRVSIYDFTNEPNIDAAKIDMGYTGYQPLDFFPFGDYLLYRMYNISLGIDNNFDGIFNEEEGDLPPSIWENSIRGWGSLLENARLNKNLYFPINYPLNTNISTDGNIVLPSKNTAYFYNVESKEVYDSLDAEMYVSCAFRVLDYLVLGQRDYAENKSYVRIKKGDFIDVKTEVGANVIDVIVYQNASGFGVVSLSEGNFGSPDAKINLLKLSTMGFGDNKEIAVGTGGNSIVANADQTKAAIVMNGSHEIHILDLLKGEIIKTFSTGTTGYGGPRDAKFSGDRLYVTTYSNQIILFDATTGKRLNAIVIDGKSEGLALTDKYLLVANSNYDNYQPSNRIFAYEIDKISNVEETVATQQTIRVYPNPVANEFNIVSDDLAGTNDIAIINGQGKIVATYSGTSNGAIALNADALGLTSGNYTAIINGTRAVRFVVIK